jgi:ABC-2 type transport system ATP-binding protein
MYVQVDAAGADVKAALERVPGVTRVALADARGTISGFEVDSEAGHDVRRALAQAIVTPGWGLLELRPMRMSLEEIFLSLTTEEAAAAATPAPPEPAPLPAEVVHE